MFQRIINLFKAFINLFISGLEKQSPEALLQLEQENLRKQVAKYNDGLGSHAALSERLMTQMKKLEAEYRELRGKISVNIKAGNQKIAGQHALRLKTVEEQMEETRLQLEHAEQTYTNLIAARDQAVQAARKKIESIKHTINDMKVQKAMAEMSEMASGMSSSIGSSGDTLDRLHGMVTEERDKAAGRARVSHDALYTNEVHMQQEERDAMEDAALAEFMEKEGLNQPAAIEHQEGIVIDSSVAEKEQVKR